MNLSPSSWILSHRPDRIAADTVFPCAGSDPELFDAKHHVGCVRTGPRDFQSDRPNSRRIGRSASQPSAVVLNHAVGPVLDQAAIVTHSTLSRR